MQVVGGTSPEQPHLGSSHEPLQLRRVLWQTSQPDLPGSRLLRAISAADSPRTQQIVLMPLPGGPSDKLGNRYELYWVVRRIIDLLTGRIEWIHIEPPGEDAIEFRCRTTAREEAHQVKRGHANGGHWTTTALEKVIDGFGDLLASKSDLFCIFVSEHAAHELQELSDRARDASNASEFNIAFVSAKGWAKAKQKIQSRWGTNDEETWLRLRRIHATTVGEAQIKEDMDAILRLLVVGAPAETARAILIEFALESVHQELRRPQVVQRLLERGIRSVPSHSAIGFMPLTTPPPCDRSSSR